MPVALGDEGVVWVFRVSGRCPQRVESGSEGVGGDVSGADGLAGSMGGKYGIGFGLALGGGVGG